MRGVVLALTLMFLPACAHAQDQPVGRGDLPGVRATANVIVHALPETRYRDYGYRWDAMSIRVSRYVRWHIYAPDDRGRAPDAVVQRNGWIDGEREDVDVAVFGDDERVTMMTFKYDRFRALDLLEGLRREGAEVSFQADYESYSEYLIAPPGREAGLLTMRRVCPPERAASMRICQDAAELTFEPFE